MIGVLYFTIISFVLAIIIVILNTHFKKTEEQVKSIRKLLPGINCGACGFVGCNEMAEELLKNPEVIDKCRILKNKEEILKILDN